MRKYIIFGFDMETDIGSYLKTYKGVRNGTGKIVSVLEKYDIPATFLFTGDTAEGNEGIARELSEKGFELGCHSLKHETVGDAGFNMPNDNPILESELENRLIMNRDIIRRLTGKEPVTFRAPRLWQGNGQIRILEKLGFWVDASYSVAAHKQQILPYHPSEQNWLKQGSMKLLEIPNFAFLDKENDYSKFFCKNEQWPLMRLLGADFVFENTKHIVQKQSEVSGVSVLLFYLHPWEFEEMPEKYEYDEGTFYFRPELFKNCGNYMLEEFEKYIQLSLKEDFAFITCEDFYNVWEETKDGRN